MPPPVALPYVSEQKLPFISHQVNWQTRLIVGQWLHVMLGAAVRWAATAGPAVAEQPQTTADGRRLTGGRGMALTPARCRSRRAPLDLCRFRLEDLGDRLTSTEPGRNDGEGGHHGERP